MVGFVAAEIYMFFAVLGPNSAGLEVPPGPMLGRIAVALFCGLFGALVGLGLGLLVTALVNRLRR